MLFRAKLNSYYAHLFSARQKRKANDRPAAVREYQKALAVFPGNTQLQEEFAAYENPRERRQGGGVETDRGSAGAAEHQER